MLVSHPAETALPAAHSRPSLARRAIVWVLLLGLIWPPAPLVAEQVVLTDGRTLEGKFAPLASVIAKDQTVPDGAPVPELILMNDTGLKRVFVPKRNVREVLHNAGNERREVIKVRQHIGSTAGQVNNIGAITRITPFDEFGRRTYVIGTANGEIPVIQGITEISPDYVRVRGLTHSWDMRMATNSIAPQVLDTIVAKAINPENEDDRLAVVRFLIQARRYGDAKEAIDQLVAEFPALRDRVAPIGRDLVQLRARQILNEIEVRRDAGQYQLVQGMLTQFPADGVAGEILQTVRAMAGQVADQNDRIAATWGQFHQVFDQLTPAEQEQVAPIRDEIFARRVEFRSEDFPAAIRFCSILSEQWHARPRDSVATGPAYPSPGRRIGELLGPDLRGLIDQVAIAGGINPQTQGGPILAGLNDVLRSPELYTREDFATVVIPVEARALIDRGIETLTPTQVARLNRVLLEAAYPDDIRTSDFVGITPTTLRRLEAFLQLLDDSSLSPQQKMALGISGWLVGSNNALSNLTVALSLFRVRNLVREYVNEELLTKRQRIVDAIRAEEAGTPALVAALLAHMLPPVPTPTQQAPGFFELTVDTIEGEPPVKYFVQLPPEYDPYARYPAIITLNGAATVAAYPAGTTGEDMTRPSQMAWWAGPPAADGQRGGQSMRHGYIVIAPEWTTPQQREYGYSAREHAAVLSALRDACRRFAIDTDRVFLSGHDIGGDAAWDLALSHPDLWAGVVPIVGRSDKYCAQYWPNAELLSVYTIGGELDADLVIQNARELDRYLRRGWDITYVEYRGRGHEHFGEDILDIFDWMKRRRRNFYPPEFEMNAMRPWDNFFYWVEVNALPPATVVLPNAFDQQRGRRPAKIGASVKANGALYVSGSSDVTLWLSPEIVNFDEQVEIHVNRRRHKLDIAPDLNVMLEDARTRADRQHPFWARFDSQ